MNYYKYIKHFVIFCTLIFTVWSFANVLNILITGNFSFWYDPARDLLLAVNNLSKLTLLGPPTGIPDIFYGPYWIWMLSIGLSISRNPRLTTFLVATLPYITVIPYILYKMKPYLGLNSVILIWLLILYARIELYATNIWNPYVSIPLFIVLSFFILVEKPKRFILAYSIVIGIIVGLILNVHISFGLGVAVGAFLYLVISSFITLHFSFFKKSKQAFLSVALYFCGITVSFLPFLLFEIRHHFLQISAIIRTLEASSHNIASVGVLGFDKALIFHRFIGIPGELFSLSEAIGFILVVVLVVLYIASSLRTFYRQRTKDLYDKQRFHLVLFLIAVLVSQFTIYITSKNPVWEYHFVGIEIIFILLISAIAGQFNILSNIILAYVIILISFNSNRYIDTTKQWGVSNYSISSLATKEQVIETIVHDSQGKEYEVFGYNPAIYVHDYDYLMLWRAKKNVLHNPTPHTVDYKYLIIPLTEEAVFKDFIEFMTPSDLYTTGQIFTLGDNIKVIRREKTTFNTLL